MDTTVNGAQLQPFYIFLRRAVSDAAFPLPLRRLNKPYRESVNEDEILAILRPMIKSYALERNDGEHFGDWVIRKGIISATRQGLDFYENAFPGQKEVEAEA